MTQGDLFELAGLAIITGYSDPRFTAATPILVDTRRSLAIPSGADVAATTRTILGRRPDGHTGKFAIVTRSEPLRFDRFVLGLAIEDLFDARVVALMKLIEVDGLAAGSGLQPDRKRNQSKGDVTLPDRSGHGIPPVTHLG